MARPRNIVRTVEVHVMLPEPLVARIYALLVSDLDSKIPFGAQAKFFARAAEDLLTKLEMENGNNS